MLLQAGMKVTHYSKSEVKGPQLACRSSQLPAFATQFCEMMPHHLHVTLATVLQFYRGRVESTLKNNGRRREEWGKEKEEKKEKRRRKRKRRRREWGRGRGRRKRDRGTVWLASLKCFLLGILQREVVNPCRPGSHSTYIPEELF